MLFRSEISCQYFIACLFVTDVQMVRHDATQRIAQYPLITNLQSGFLIIHIHMYEVLCMCCRVMGSQ